MYFCYRYRGFDTFYGFLSAAQGYFNHSGSAGVSLIIMGTSEAPPALA